MIQKVRGGVAYENVTTCCFPLLSPDAFLSFCVGSPLISSLVRDTWLVEADSRETERDDAFDNTTRRSAAEASMSKRTLISDPPEGRGDGRMDRKMGGFMG